MFKREVTFKSLLGVKGLIPYEKELTVALSIYVDILVNSLFNTFQYLGW